MIEELKKMLSIIEESITYAEESDLAYTSHYKMLCKKRKILKNAVKMMIKAER